MKKLLAAFGLALAMAGSPAQAASLIGDTVTCSQVGAGSSFSCFTNSAVVSGAREFEVGVVPNAAIGLNFNGGGLRITNLSGGPLVLAETIVTLSDISKLFTSARLLNSSIIGFGSSDVTLQNGSLRLNFVNTIWTRNSTANIALETAAAVPEPGTWAMMLVGLGAMGAALRSRRRKKLALQF